MGAFANSPATARALKRAISDRRMYTRPQMLTVLSILILRQRHTVADERPVCSVNLSSDIIGSGSGRFILEGKVFRNCEQDCGTVLVA